MVVFEYTRSTPVHLCSWGARFLILLVHYIDNMNLADFSSYACPHSFRGGGGSESDAGKSVWVDYKETTRSMRWSGVIHTAPP